MPSRRRSIASRFWSRCCSSPPSPAGSCTTARAPGGLRRARSVAALALLIGSLAPFGAARAQTPPQPILGPVPLPATPIGRGLNQAYGAIVRAGVSNPGAAQRAQYDYVQALQKARAGDRAGSLAAAARAQADAIEGAPAVAAPRAYAPAQSAIAPAARVQPGVPIVENGPALSGDLLVARNELTLAGEVTHANLDDAKQTYRRALDDYLSGNAERSQAEARAAFDAAADALSRAK